MNYRQWKKKYKKIHGHNPTVSEDKRKKSKLKKTYKEVDVEVLKKIGNDIIDVIARGFRFIGEAFINASDNLK